MRSEKLINEKVDDFEFLLTKARAGEGLTRGQLERLFGYLIVIFSREERGEE